MQLSNRTVLVTGGTEGIGRALVEALVQRGCQVLICARHLPATPLTMSGASGGRVSVLCCDLSTDEGRRTLVAEVHARHTGLSVVVHNAAVQHLVDFTQAPLASIEASTAEELALNLTAPVLLSAALLPILQRQPDSVIVNITTGLALAPKRSSPVYCATKAALRSFTRSLRYQLEDGPGRVSVVEALPPLVDTRMTHGRGSAKMSPAKVAAALIAGVERGQDEIYIGKSGLLKLMLRISPALVYRILKNW